MGESPPLLQTQPAGSAEPRQPSRGHTGQQLSPRLLTLEDAAKTLQMSTASLRRLISAGKLPTVRPTRRILLDPQDVEDFIRRSKTRAW